MEERIYSNKYLLVDEKESVLAEIDFPLVGDNTIEITHTIVSPSLQGQRIAKKLVEKVLEIAKDKGYKVTASCSYAKRYLEKNNLL